MIEQALEEFGDDCKIPLFTVMCDGFNGVNGFVQLEFRRFDNEAEGSGLNISAMDDKVIKNGDYSPVELSKEETAELIKFLQKAHDEMIDDWKLSWEK